MTQVDPGQAEKESMVNFGETFSESRQYSHFEETIQCISDVPHLERRLSTQVHNDFFKEATEQQSENERSANEACYDDVTYNTELPEEIDNSRVISTSTIGKSSLMSINKYNGIAKSNKQQLNVFSGPNYPPNSYSFKSCSDFRKSFFKPEQYVTDAQRSRFLIPNVPYYFQEAYNEHSFYLEEGVSDDYPEEEAPPRHKRFLHPRQQEDQYDDTDHNEETSEDLHGELADYDTDNSNHTDTDELYTDDDNTEDPEAMNDFTTTIRRNSPGKRASTPTSLNDSKPAKKKARYRQSSRDLPAHDSNLRKSASRIEAVQVPNKAAAIEKLFHLTKFLMFLQVDESVSYECVICFENSCKSDVVQCNNPFCEVKVHRNCYWTDIANTGTWNCERCKYYNESESGSFLGNRCALCPDTTGLFCKLESNNVDIPYAHYVCAAIFLGRSNTTNEYLANFEHIPVKKYESVCAHCEQTSTLSAFNVESCLFGAKLANGTITSHITCIQKHVNPSIVDILANSSATVPPRNLKPYQNYLNWINKRNDYIKEHFKKEAAMFSLDIWKMLARKQQLSIEMGSSELNDRYNRFLAEINAATYRIENTYYNSWVDYSLSLIASKFSKRQFEKMGELSIRLLTSKVQYNYQYNKSASKSLNKTKNVKPKKIAVKDGAETLNNDFKANDRAKKTEKLGAVKGKRGRKPTGRSKVVMERPSQPKVPPIRSNRKLLESKAVVPSDNLVCAICKSHHFPEARYTYLGLDTKYALHLKETQHQRKPGFTGRADYWDPSVFIKCSDCGEIVHCGCPGKGIRDYPSRHETYLCQQCDPSEEKRPAGVVNTKRPRKATNYKV